MPTAKVTSKGQITVPVSVRRALDVGRGDILAFEVKADYVVVRRQEQVREVVTAAQTVTAGLSRSFAAEDDAIASGVSDTEAEGLESTLLRFHVGSQDTR